MQMLGSHLPSAKNTAPVVHLEHAIARSDEERAPLLDFLSGKIDLPAEFLEARIRGWSPPGWVTRPG